MVTISRKEYEGLRSQLSAALLLIEELQEQIGFMKNGRNSRTSSTPSSQDYGKTKIYNSREKSTKKTGGQKGHKGSSLKMNETPDKTLHYLAQYCNHCGAEFNGDTQQKPHIRKQEIVIPAIKVAYLEHQSYSCTCGNCHLETTVDLPSHLRANIQYGVDFQALVTYLSVYQYMPSNRIKTYLKDVLNVDMSEGTIYNFLKSMGKKSQPVYEVIKEKIGRAEVVGGDESGVKINGDKAWFWVFQNREMTYIKVALSRGFKSITETFPVGFPSSIYVSDSLATQLKVGTKAKQLCLAHLLRELNNFEDVLQLKWASNMKALLKNAMTYKRTMTPDDYDAENQVLQQFEARLSKLLAFDCSKRHKKLRAFINRLNKNRASIFTFLYHPKVPYDNNSSERAIRNIKVKMKISNQFKSLECENENF